MNVTLLKTDKDKHIADAKDLLVELSNEGFESVVVAGVKDGKMYVQRSATVSQTELVGLLYSALERITKNGWEE